MSVWLAQLVKALVAPTHVRSCVQEVRVRSPEQTSSTLASIPPGRSNEEQLLCSLVPLQKYSVKACGSTMGWSRAAYAASGEHYLT